MINVLYLRDIGGIVDNNIRGSDLVDLSLLPRAVQVVIPNVMGLVLYHPNIDSETGVSAESERFCRSLVSQYRVNFFDQLVNHDKGVKIEKEIVHSNDGDITLFYKLCSAAAAGDLDSVHVPLLS